VLTIETSSHLLRLNILNDRFCLDFANTAGWHATENPSEWIKNYEDLVVWSHLAGILSEGKRDFLLKQTKSVPEEAAAVYREAIQLRETMYRIFRDVLNDSSCSEDDLIVLNKSFTRANEFLELERNENQFDYRFKETNELDTMLWVVVKSAADFLTSSELKRLKECEGGGCGWLFIDTSRNHSRRWCSMEDCGNREKARRHYQKKKK
jgi:predicted RNA-binding Zn ribbon-like protein